MMKKAQEEMIGFALIIIIVSVILLVFLGFMIRDKGETAIESYEINNFLNSIFLYTTECEDIYGFTNVKELIVNCYNQEECLDGKASCDVLTEVLEGISKNAWEKEVNVKGYEFSINSSRGSLVYIKQGNLTKTYKASSEILGRERDINIIFRAYF